MTYINNVLKNVYKNYLYFRDLAYPMIRKIILYNTFTHIIEFLDDNIFQR